MKKYTYLLFDVDGTLMDFNRAEREAYIEALHGFNVFERHPSRIFDFFTGFCDGISGYFQLYTDPSWSDRF